MHGWIGTATFMATAEAILARAQDRAWAADLADRAAGRHNDRSPRPGLPTNQAFCPGAGPIDPAWLVQAMAQPSPCSMEDWSAWSGDHRGTWYDAASEFADHAVWQPPTPALDDRQAPGIVQRVHCYADTPAGPAPQRRGWNATRHGLPWALGWDPKRVCDLADPMQAVHVGLAFRPPTPGDRRHVILWVLSREAFLECVDPGAGRRVSTRVVFDGDDAPGFGQWRLMRLRGSA